MGFSHEPVLLRETVAALNPPPGGMAVDCTAGGGGHSHALGELLGAEGRLIALDRDPSAVAAASVALADVACRWDVVQAPFSELDSVLTDAGIAPGSVDAILADIGVSSHQIDSAERGFSFATDGPLDMRMDPTQGLTAADLVNTLDVDELADVLFQFGDERKSRRIARALVRRRDDALFERTADLAAAIDKAMGGRRGSRIHPATRSFQALRIAVNGEMDELDTLLRSALSWLKPGGRLGVITFHSGEDRRVKRWFALLRSDCHCEPKGPTCTCGWEPQVRLPKGKGWSAEEDELARNPRSRSARLRVAERLDTPLMLPPEGAHVR
jgi:16S rRNA (cytosine1402-N4)-methyltransferase